MSRRTLSLFTIVVLTSAAALAQPTVTLTLDSPQDSLVVPIGATIEWSVSVSVSTGDNEGLALFVCDLEQNAGNPELFDIPPADGVPAGMYKFTRPAGVSNPGETDPNTGYIGVQRGTTGQMNLRQIGGGQNTFGEALPPGSGIGEEADCVAGVGQSSAEFIAAGSFTAPSTCGSYSFQAVNAAANVITTHNTPPDFSPVAAATIIIGDDAFEVTVTILGDLDGNYTVDLSDLAQLLGNYNVMSGMSYMDGDLDGDGDVDLADLAELLGRYNTSC